MNDANTMRSPRAGWNFFAALRRALCGVRTAVTGDRYRPEQHYMRGPGPKTREKMQRSGGAGA